MTSLAKQAPLSWLELFSAQTAVVYLTRRKGVAIFLAFVLAQVIALAGFGVILGITITINDEVTNVGVTSISDFQEELDLEAPRSILSLGAAFVLLSGFALFWPFSVWSRERPSERGYHWSLPVPRQIHDLARVAAGAALLLAMLVGVYVASILFSIVGGHTEGLGSMPLGFWGGLVLGPLIPYALVSIFAVRFEHPAGWFWGLFGALGMLSTISGLVGLTGVNSLLKGLAVGPLGLFSAVGGSVWSGISGGVAGWGGASGLGWCGVWGVWMALLAGAVVLAASARRTRD